MKIRKMLLLRVLFRPSLLPLCLLLLVGSGCSSMDTGPGETNLSPAPQFQATDLQGKTRYLQTYRGRTVLLTFWATWCSLCTAEMESLKLLQRRLEPYGLMVVAVAIDDAANRVEIFAREHNLNFPVLIDQTGEVKAAYEVQGLPEAFVINPRGELMKIVDPETGEESDRISGPQEWSSKEAYTAMLRLLKR